MDANARKVNKRGWQDLTCWKLWGARKCDVLFPLNWKNIDANPRMLGNSKKKHLEVPSSFGVQ